MKSATRFLLPLVLAAFSLNAFADGVIKGTVKTNAGKAPRVIVVIKGGSFEKIAETDGSGRFTVDKVPAGTYTVEFSFPGLIPYSEKNVEVTDDGVAQLDITMQAPLNLMEVITVASASKRPERIVEAPAAVTVITAKELEAQAASGQLPRVLESTPGVELAQSGVFDFNINARGFNSSLNRRILVLVDGRDPATGFLGNQEWSALTFPLDEVESMELVRGPGAALYGANAFNGVMNIRTKRPVDTLGGKVSLSGGNLASRRIDFRYADEFGFGWSYRVNASLFGSDTWSESRTAADRDANGQFEYAGLENNVEQVSIEDEVEGRTIGLRLDKEFLQGWVLSLEAGYANIENGIAVTGIGRVQIDESERPWFRANFNTPHFNVIYSYSGRNTPIGQTALSTGSKLFEDSVNQLLEVQANYEFWNGRIQAVAGASYRDQSVDTSAPFTLPDGSTVIHHTLMAFERDADQQALFGQVTIEAHEKLDIVLAGRWDDSTLHDPQESPKAALVYKVNQNHSLRATYNEAFQVANFSELNLRAGSSSIIPYGLVQDGVVLGAFGLDLRNTLDANGNPILNWQNIPAVAAGNPDLVPEHIESVEIGYKGIVGSNVFLTIDAYKSTITNFVTDLLPGVNRNLAPFVIQEDIPAVIANALSGTLAGALGASYGGLTNQTDLTNPSPIGVPNGHPTLVVSYTNAGEVETEGVDIAFNWYLNDKWTVDGNYSWFDFEVIDQLVGDALVPNSSENKINLGVAYNDPHWDISAKLHVVEGFDWNAGAFSGEIPDYETVNLSIGYRFNEAWKVGFTGNNLFDNKHIELFGGSINGLRALAYVNYAF